MSTEHKKPIIAEVDLSEAWDKESMREMIIERLKQLGIPTENLLFRGCDTSKTGISKVTGDGKVTLLIPDEDLNFSEESELANEASALEDACDNEKAGLALYDKEQLIDPNFDERVINASRFKLRPKIAPYLKDALVAILKLKIQP